MKKYIRLIPSEVMWVFPMAELILLIKIQFYKILFICGIIFFVRFVKPDWGLLESECNNKLNSIFDPTKQGNFNYTTTTKGNKYLSINKLHPNILTLYFYSIILRQCIQQRLNNNSDILARDFEDAIRKIVVNEIYKSFTDITNSHLYKTYPEIIVIANLNLADFTKSFVCPSNTISNPDIFYMGIVDCLIFKPGDVSKEFSNLLGLSLNILDDE